MQVPLPVDTKSGYYWYNYSCSPSTETRGANRSQGKGCGRPMYRKSKRDLEKTGEKIQGVRCPNCGNRKRFGWGDTYSSEHANIAVRKGVSQAIYEALLRQWEGTQNEF